MGFNLLTNSGSVSMECCVKEGFKTASGLIRKFSNKKEMMPVVNVRRKRRESGSRQSLSICLP